MVRSQSKCVISWKRMSVFSSFSCFEARLVFVRAPLWGLLSPLLYWYYLPLVVHSLHLSFCSPFHQLISLVLQVTGEHRFTRAAATFLHFTWSTDSESAFCSKQNIFTRFHPYAVLKFPLLPCELTFWWLRSSHSKENVWGSRVGQSEVWFCISSRKWDPIHRRQVDVVLCWHGRSKTSQTGHRSDLALNDSFFYFYSWGILKVVF